MDMPLDLPIQATRDVSDLAPQDPQVPGSAPSALENIPQAPIQSEPKQQKPPDNPAPRGEDSSPLPKGFMGKFKEFMKSEPFFRD